ncbi:cytochrome P450 734A1-like [Pyrus ussuriensis x Pyrus communis]|uniref:Cytochrome P450 734A1-like n=1 Tax=Pyrus ussuriensis x Pyrus communis TaxID=2448454 RepID=A0A5N5HKM7_9ROSA|nr:cytochrome P450 734A1-like [Pyrus ussuriensis x Pyrus communis]
MLARQATKKVKLGSLEIPVGAQIYLALVALHHDTDIWGEDAKEFIPSRFLEPQRHSASFILFGLGPRICAGQISVVVETKLTLALIIQLYSFTVSPTYVHAPMLFLTLMLLRALLLLSVGYFTYPLTLLSTHMILRLYIFRGIVKNTWIWCLL